MDDHSQLLERYRRGAELVSEALAGAGEAEFDFKPAPDKWSLRYIVAHLADTEATTVVRLRQVISEDNPTITPWDQESWAAHTGYDHRNPLKALETMRRLREDNYELLEDISPEAWSRSGNHLERGPTTVLQFVELFAHHAEAHASQIQNVRAAYKQQHAK